MKKILALAAASLLVAGAAFAQDMELAFENDLYTGIVDISNDGASFGGFEDEVIVEFTSERVDFKVDATTDFLAQDEFELGEYDVDWYVEFRPVQMLTLGFSDPVFTTGSYLPLADDNIGTGNIATTNGFATILRPINGLRIGAGLDFGAKLGNSEIPAIGFGFDYVLNNSEKDLLAFGASCRDVANDGRSFGGYFSFLGLDGATINLGYSYNDEGFSNVAGNNLLNFSAVYKSGAFTTKAEAVTNFGSKSGEAKYDLYGALLFGYVFNDKFGADFRARTWVDFSNTVSSPKVDFRPRAKFFFGNHTILAGVSTALTIKETVEYAVSFPIVYVYAF